MKKIFAIFFLIFLPLFSFGQIGLPEGINDQISIDLSNSTPNPNEFVSIKVASYTGNLNKADISWSVNGVLQKRELGATSFSFQVGDFGSTTQLSLVIIKSDGGKITKNYTFRPMEVDLIYQAETSTPFNYSGKALFSNQSAIKVFAEPRLIDGNGAIIPKENLVYSWKINGFARQELSGYGKDFIFYAGSLITRPLEIDVEVSSINSDSYAKKKLIIDPIEPFVMVYEKNPTLGVIYEQAIQNDFALDRQEVEFRSENLFFSKNSAIVKKWFLNGNELYNSQNLNEVVFRNEDNSSGVANVSIDIRNENRILQGAYTDFGLIFNLEE